MLPLRPLRSPWGGDLGEAETAAETVIARNVVGGRSPQLQDIRFGEWDFDAQTFDEMGDEPNSAQVTVSWVGDDAVGLFLARTIGFNSVNITGTATAATRHLHIILSIDITNSWSESNFGGARDAALVFWDTVTLSYSALDRMGMVLFYNRYGVKYSELDYIIDHVSAGERADWAVINKASKAAASLNDPYDGAGCAINSDRTDFTTVPDGCYPDMPREYNDEWGTDHSVGVYAAGEMFRAHADDDVYRALVVLTDGFPVSLSSSAGDVRNTDGYVEGRWNEYIGITPHSESQIRIDSPIATGELWDELQVNT